MYIWFEEKLEGAANKRKKQDSNKLNANLAIRKTLKHIAWWAIAIATGLTFVGYFIPIKELVVGFFNFNSTLLACVLGTVLRRLYVYANAGWMRSIVCLHMCPYARFQSAMFDKDTFIVGYDTPNVVKAVAPCSRKSHHKQPAWVTVLTVIYVQVCPTGIDIRDGLQYECVLTVARVLMPVDNTMERMGYEKGLINYTTEHRLEGHSTKVMRPKLLGYGVILIVMLGLFFRTNREADPAGLSVLRDRNQPFKINSQGLVGNTYNLKVINKTQQEQEYKLDVSGYQILSGTVNKPLP